MTLITLLAQVLFSWTQLLSHHWIQKVIELLLVTRKQIRNFALICTKESTNTEDSVAFNIAEYLSSSGSTLAEPQYLDLLVDLSSDYKPVIDSSYPISKPTSNTFASPDLVSTSYFRRIASSSFSYFGLQNRQQYPLWFLLPWLTLYSCSYFLSSWLALQII